MAACKMYHEIYGFIAKKDGLKVLTRTAQPDIYEDTELDLTSNIQYDFNMWEGDRIKIYVECTEPPKVYRIEPQELLQKHVGKITILTKSFGVVDDNILFYVNKEVEKCELKEGDEVQCQLIDGYYEVGRDNYEIRCVSIQKYNEEDIKCLLLNESLNSTKENNEPNGASDDSDTENDNDPQMRFEGLQDQEPKEKRYDLPYGLFETLQANNANKIKKKLDVLVPNELTYKTYKDSFHALIYLEEVEMKKSFEKYKTDELWIQPENKRFSILCDKITELRPPIAIGDKIEVCSNDLRRRYRGIVERVHDDRFILKFRKEFAEEFVLGVAYKHAEFFYSRTMFQRKHAAIDYAKMKMPESFLFPKKVCASEKFLLNVSLQEDKLMLDDKEIPWFKDGLNEEQKKAVTYALKGECRPNPFIIFGPPGTGKTSTLIEIILQVSTHEMDSKILVATQSNTAANILASRLIKGQPDIGKSMLRLVSNAALDRKTLPQELHKYSASIQNQYIDEEDLLEIDEATVGGVKRNCDLSYLKDFKIIIGTCVGLGVMFGSDLSNGYFTHVLIDEAAQCNECEAMIPITSMNIKRGQVIMAGDPIQLPPITLSNHARHLNLDKSMLERYLEIYEQMEGVIPCKENGYDCRLVAKLRRNYRSLPSILNFYNENFYNSQLIATISEDTSKEAIQLRELSTILPRRYDATNNPFGIYFVNVSGQNERLENRKSWSNQQEAEMILNFLSRLIKQKVAQEDIGIISPYYAQVKSIKKGIKKLKKVTVGTVEEFQGEEKMVILISAVKTSGRDKALQFIFCPKRLNTAISRARMLLVVFGKASLLEKDENWGGMIEYCKRNESFVEGIELLT